MITQLGFLLATKYSHSVGVLNGPQSRPSLKTFQANTSDAAPYLKAAVRDVKAYRDSKNYRKIPVGYSAGEDICYSFQTFFNRLKLLKFSCPP